MQNELIKHGFSKNKEGKNTIFEKTDYVLDLNFDGLIDQHHKIIKNGRNYFLSKVEEKNRIFSYKHFLDIFQYNDMSNYGYVYLLDYNGIYKIGMTKNIIKRFNFFKNTLPGNVKLLDYIVTIHYKDLERCLHKKFKKKLFTKFDREWFRLNENDILFFKKAKAVVEN